ncbi:ArsR/SmtB family transcription factor [Methylocystis sp. JAN1]|uniref:ArsR/SmtB family transcription factor n=1 Tax=Methylocystis sp. JAN1 TaxID=3397211 RepID=UPI003FA26995
MNINPVALAPKAEEAESFLKALANRHRLMVLCELHKDELSVTSLQETIGLSQSSLSQHLARLREDKLVKTRRESQTIYYSLADENVSRVIGLLYELFCAQDCGTPDPAGKKTRKTAKRAGESLRRKKAS